ncbi:MAG: hypothetical protein DRP11_00135 [Candidatus Aenigmatarchaeota archaeon]|nr:MAG: hypothetical protein DRP11_00135 [Candidatus Aenigmarchaeota archaeon]
MPAIYLDVRNLSQVRMQLASLEKEIPFGVEKGGMNVARKLERGMKERVNIWRGRLKRSIRARKIRSNRIGIEMLFYGRFLEEGHVLRQRRGGKIKGLPPTLTAWAREKGLEELLAYKLADQGYLRFRPHPFILPTINSIRNDIGREVQQTIIESIVKAGVR